ncbi:NAD(P)-dependent dehydrogenase, short-chain alcohol dehydrogenase family [Sphingobium faniae]|nr:NAD(P)-dependent dehydrogenase, short-chain alcohol dehydrogenase family [Sphingobium faniae]
MERPLEGKVALITGSGSGMGVGIALAVAKAGAAVALVGRTAETLEQTCAQIAAAGGRAIVAICDITDRAQVDATVAGAQAELGPIWLLVNNAVSTDNKPIEDVDDANLDLVLRSSIHGSLYMMQACFPTMKERGGRIVNFGSGGATMGLVETGAYSIAKEGVRGLTKVAATGWGQYGITVNTVCPMVATPLFDVWWQSLGEAEREHQLSMIPMRRMGDGEQDVGGLIVFLGSEGAGYITSRTLHVDGGRAFYDR